MFCTKCGTEMEEDYDFCPECGNPIKRTVTNPQMINEMGRDQSDESVPVRKKKNSIMGYEKIDGVYYWTLFYFTEEIPSDY